MMMDKGSLAIADFIIDWLRKAGAAERYVSISKVAQ